MYRKFFVTVLVLGPGMNFKARSLPFGASQALVRVGLIHLVAAAVLVSSAPAADTNALPFVSPMFGDHMVLQRGKDNTIWGWSNPGDGVRIEIAGHVAKAVTGSTGRWQARIRPPDAGGPYTLRIIGTNTVEWHDVVAGDVWLCGGQSNMELPLSRTANGDAEIRAANHPLIRLFTVKQKSSYEPEPVLAGAWKVCSPKTITEDGGFSAAGYYFALKVQSEINVPIGLIKDCIGGTPAESWTSAEGLGKLSDFGPALAEVARLRAGGGPVYGNYVMPWYDEYDIGLKGETWNAPQLEDSDWKTVSIPGGFTELGVPDTPSVCYFRKAITLPDPLPAGRAAIRLGVIERMDTVYINGHWIGASSWVENPRVYNIPGGVLKPGVNVVTIRVFKTKPEGGFESKAADLKLVLGDNSEIPLAGAWKARVSVDARPPHPMPFGFENWPVMPCVLYNGMIAPVAPLAITGVIWYQGEANASHAFQYRALLPAMIADWRRAFGQGDFPFYIVSLAAYMPRRATPGDDAWAELREAQDLTARTVRNSGLAVTIDIGDANNIHPQDKRDVGERLALLALAGNYGKKVVCSGPTFASAETLPGALKLNFKHTDGGLVTKGEKLGEFAIAGEDRKWFWADAKIDGGAIIVSSPDVPHPTAARYAWQSNPLATLYNGAGLPAVPFRTDDWPLTTQGPGR